MRSLDARVITCVLTAALEPDAESELFAPKMATHYPHSRSCWSKLEHQTERGPTMPFVYLNLARIGCYLGIAEPYGDWLISDQHRSFEFDERCCFVRRDRSRHRLDLIQALACRPFDGSCIRSLALQGSART